MITRDTSTPTQIASRPSTVILILCVALVIFVIITLAVPRRKNLLFKRALGKVEVARGCTVFTGDIFANEDRTRKAQSQLVEVQRDGLLAMYDTPIGSLWYPVGAWDLPAVVATNEAETNELRPVIKPNDVVLDVGAGIGTETRFALSAGARYVIAIEPQRLSQECFRRNLSAEIRDNRAVLLPEAVSDTPGKLALHAAPEDAGSAKFTGLKTLDSREVPATTIDDAVTTLHLSKVDLIRLEAGNAEKVLEGARETIRRDHPRLAIVLQYHVRDADVLPAVARRIWPGYRVQLSSCTKTLNRIHPAIALLTP